MKSILIEKYNNLIKKTEWIYSLIKNINWHVLLKLAFQKKHKKSVIFFSQHKSASTFVAQIMQNIEKANVGLKHVNYPNLISDVGCYLNFGHRFNSENDWFYENSNILFQKTGFIYGPHRAPFFIWGLEHFKKIIFLRDPRDSLVSRYYSFGYTHGVPKDIVGGSLFLEERNKIHNETIDSYCLRMAILWSKPLLKNYKKILESSLEEPLCIKYEDYIINPRAIINKIFDYCELSDMNKLTEKLYYKANPVQNQINPLAHQRSGQSGQYKNELKQETILEINQILRDELDFFEWNLCQ